MLFRSTVLPEPFTTIYWLPIRLHDPKGQRGDKAKSISMTCDLFHNGRDKPETFSLDNEFLALNVFTLVPINTSMRQIIIDQEFCNKYKQILPTNYDL